MNTALPTITSSDVVSRNTSKSCYVTVGANVYDVASFLKHHPGREDLILKYGGKDVSEVMQDEGSHIHSKAAYEILDEYLVGFVTDESVMKNVVQDRKSEDTVPTVSSTACKPLSSSEPIQPMMSFFKSIVKYGPTPRDMHWWNVPSFEHVTSSGLLWMPEDTRTRWLLLLL